MTGPAFQSPSQEAGRWGSPSRVFWRAVQAGLVVTRFSVAASAGQKRLLTAVHPRDLGKQKAGPRQGEDHQPDHRGRRVRRC